MRLQQIVFGGILVSLVLALPLAAQNASLVGTVKDQQEAVVPNATVTLTNLETKTAQTVETDSAGNYEFPIVRPGSYSLKAEHPGFKTYVQSPITMLVAQRGRADVALQLGEAATTVTVASEVTGVQTETSNLGAVVDTKKIAEIPLNGRFFLDLALLMPGTTVPSTNNRTFLAVPSGIGISGINASGTREDATNYLFDGINLSDMVQNQITFQPNIDMIQEFKVQTNAFSAEYGRNAGIIINSVGKSGTNSFHGTAYEFVRNDHFDAKNFFDSPTAKIPPFKRNIYGYSIGGPIIRNKTFFFQSYEGRQGRESASLNTPVPSDAQRAAVTNPVVKQLLTLLPSANSPSGNFVGAVPRERTLNQFTGKFDHVINERNLLFATLLSNRDQRTEPTLQGNNLPGFGDLRPAQRYFLALGYTRVISPAITNEFHAGLNRVHIGFFQAATQNATSFGMTTGSAVTPEFIVGGGPAFGGITGFPQGRGDTTFQYTDTLAWVRGRHSFKFGAEYRRFRNNNFAGGTGGLIRFANMTTFLAGTPSTVTQLQLGANSSVRVNAFDTFAQDDYKVTSRLTLNLGLRWEYNGVPSEVFNRFGVFDFSQKKVIRVGTGGIERPYKRQFTNFGPRFGFSYDPFGKGKTVIRGGAGLYYDQPVTNIVTGMASNPPFSNSVTFTSNINLASPFSQPGGAPATFAVAAVDPNFQSGRVLSYNLNIQHEAFNTVFEAAYVGSQGRHLRISGDYNQGIGGVRPIAGFSSITIQQSISNSNYNGLWLSANRRLTKGLTFNTSYTFSKSIDNNSVGSSNPQAQNYRALNLERALSDFDARHRFVLSGVYLLPFNARTGLMKRLAEGWSIAPIINLQSGSPFSPIIGALRSGSLVAFDRPDLTGQPLYTPNQDPSLYLNPAAFALNQTGHFGNAGRNILTAPGFSDVDFAVAKNTLIKERFSVQFRAEAFNLLNHPNFGQPVNQVDAGTFGKIQVTRTARGDLGSSRQLQLGMKLIF